MIFAVFDVLLAVNMCINYIFYIYSYSYATYIYLPFMVNKDFHGRIHKESRGHVTRASVTAS